MSLNIEGVTIYLWCIDSYEDLQWGNGESPKQGSEKTQQMLFRSYTWLDFTLKLRTSSLPKFVFSYDRLPESQCDKYHGWNIQSWICFVLRYMYWHCFLNTYFIFLKKIPFRADQNNLHEKESGFVHKRLVVESYERDPNRIPIRTSKL